MIDIKNLTFSYAQDNIFDNVSCRIDESWHLALIGRNGRGKTTLLNLLNGKYDYRGEISTNKQFTYFPQIVEEEKKTELTYYVLDSLANFEDWELKRELNLLNFPEDALWRPFKSLSGGEQTKALLSLLFLDKDNFALIDEPTNHLDLESRKKVAQYLKAKKQGYILVSHDRDFLDMLADHVLAIEKEQLIIYQGNYSTYDAEKKARDEYELAQNEKLKSEISRLKKTAKDKELWSRGREKDKYGKANVKGSGGIFDTGAIGARAARVMKKSKNLEARMNRDIEDKEKLLKNLEFITDLSMNYEPTYKNRLLDLKDISVSFDGENLFDPLSFELIKGQVLAISGPNGAGKSQLLEKIYQEGVAKNLTISRVRQIYDNEGFLKDWCQKEKLEYEFLLNNLKKLGLERNVFEQRIEDMSMGQQKKVELARSLTVPAELYIWDEPLNYLDVFNHEQIEELLLQVRPTMIIVEHDEHFINSVASQVIQLHKIKKEN